MASITGLSGTRCQTQYPGPTACSMHSARAGADVEPSASPPA
jgi:hypothetical protein